MLVVISVRLIVDDFMFDFFLTARCHRREEKRKAGPHSPTLRLWVLSGAGRMRSAGPGAVLRRNVGGLALVVQRLFGLLPVLLALALFTASLDVDVIGPSGDVIMRWGT